MNFFGYLNIFSGDHCTDIFTNSDTPCWGHNEDGYEGDDATTYFTNITIVDENNRDIIIEKFFAFTYPGTIAGDAYGWNFHGLLISQNAIDADQLNYYGVPGQIVTRATFMARSPEEAAGILETSHTSNSFNMNFASTRSNKMTNVEVAPVEFVVGVHDVTSIKNVVRNPLPKTFAEKYYYYHTNTYLTLSTPCSPDASSIHRLVTLNTYKIPNSTSDIQTMLGDTSDSDYPIYRSGNSKDDPYRTLTTVVYDLVQSIAYVHKQNPRDNQPFLVINLW